MIVAPLCPGTARRRPRTGIARASPATMSSVLAPTACAAAAAASAFATFCRPSSGSQTSTSSPSGRRMRNSEPVAMKLRLAEHAAIGGRRETERDRELAARARDPVAAELIVGVEHRRAGTRQMVEQLAFRDADAAQRAEALEMRLGRVRDDADRRLREPREIVDLAGMVRTELDDEQRRARRSAASASAARRCRCSSCPA